MYRFFKELRRLVRTAHQPNTSLPMYLFGKIGILRNYRGIVLGESPLILRPIGLHPIKPSIIKGSTDVYQINTT